MGLFRNFSSSNLSSAAPLFEIRVDNDIIVLRGTEAEAASQMLKGSVVLCLRESIKVQEIHLKLTGTCKVGWTDHKMTATGMSTTKVGTASNFYSHIFNPPFASQQTLQAGNYEWPFEVILPGHLPESVLGLPDSFITYTLKAVVERGLLAHNLQAKKLIRIVRTFDPSALELSHTMTVENIWPNKIEYSIVIPQKAIIFGTAIQVKMTFTSLLKGLKIGKIRCCLSETQEYTIPGPTRSTDKYHKTVRDIDTWTFELDEDSYHETINEGGSDGWVKEKSLPLPKQLSKCMQDVDTNGLKIRHKVKFNIALHNPDGHISELRATLPITIFISPNMPIDEDGNLLDQAPTNNGLPMELGAGAPPLYGQHVLDQIYGGVDYSGIMTPGPGTQSGVNTPYHPYAQSRPGSSDGLPSSLNGIANGAVPPFAVPPSALTARLQSLNGSVNNSFGRRGPYHTGSGGNTPHAIPEEFGYSGQRSPSQQTGGDYFTLDHSQPRYQSHSNGHSAPNSNPISRRPSYEMLSDATNGQGLYPAMMSNPTSGSHTPEHVDFAPTDLENLNKVPSYTTALKTPLRGMSYSENWALPNYETAISRSASPNRSGHNTPETVGSPPRVTTNGPTPPNGSRSHAPSPVRTNSGILPRPHSVLGLTGLAHMVHNSLTHGLNHSSNHGSNHGSHYGSRNSTHGTTTPAFSHGSTTPALSNGSTTPGSSIARMPQAHLTGNSIDDAAISIDAMSIRS